VDSDLPWLGTTIPDHPKIIVDQLSKEQRGTNCPGATQLRAYNVLIAKDARVSKNATVPALAELTKVPSRLVQQPEINQIL